MTESLSHSALSSPWLLVSSCQCHRIYQVKWSHTLQGPFMLSVPLRAIYPLSLSYITISSKCSQMQHALVLGPAQIVMLLLGVTIYPLKGRFQHALLNPYNLHKHSSSVSSWASPQSPQRTKVTPMPPGYLPSLAHPCFHQYDPISYFSSCCNKIPQTCLKRWRVCSDSQRHASSSPWGRHGGVAPSMAMGACGRSFSTWLQRAQTRTIDGYNI